MKSLGEFEFIKSVMPGCVFSGSKIIMGIGDDCAVFGPYDGKVFLMSTDLLIEGVHFLIEKILPEHLGEKTVNVNLSDIAAMGGVPLHLLVSLAVPEHIDISQLQSIYTGIKKSCGKYGVNILGGDTSASRDSLMISVTVIGTAHENNVLYRKGACPGDNILVTGNLGDSAGGLQIITGKARSGLVSERLIDAHYRPVPELEVGRVISDSMLASSMIDISDGLIQDLGHICDAGNVGAEIIKEDLPVSGELKELAAINGFDPYEVALSGGEDYRLLFTVPEKKAEMLRDIVRRSCKRDIHSIGKITKHNNIKILDKNGSEILLPVKGYDHFMKP